MLSPKRRPVDERIAIGITQIIRSEISHYFSNATTACAARNIALFHGQEEASELPARIYRQNPCAIFPQIILLGIRAKR